MDTRSTLTRDTPDAPPRFFGPQVVRAAFVLALFGWGVGFYGPPVFMHAVVQRTGWSLALVSSAVTLHFLSGVVVVANLPPLHARFGVASTAVAGSVVTSLGVWGWATAAQPWQLALAALLSGAGWVTMGAVAVHAVVSPWYVHGRPLALARAYNGASIGGVVFSPLWVALIAATGFARAAWLVGAVMVTTIGLLARVVLAKRPQDLGQAPDGDRLATRATPGPRQPGPVAWRDRRFATLAAGMALGLFAQIGLVAHLFAWLVPTMGPSAAGWLMGAATACAIGGRSAAARVLARVDDRRAVAAVAYGLQAVGSLVLLAAGSGATAWLVLGVLLFGSGIGNATSLPPLIAQSEFEAGQVPRVVARIVALSQAAYAFAPAVFGVLLTVQLARTGLVDGGGSVGLFATAAAIQLAAAVCLLAGRRR